MSFLAPKIPAPTPLPAPASVPTIDDAAAAQAARTQAAQRRGRAATILTGATGDPTAAPVSAKTLLGA